MTRTAAFASILAAALLAAGAAQAATPPAKSEVSLRALANWSPAPTANAPVVPLRYTPPASAAMTGFPKTSVDHGFGPNGDDSALGEAGFLCGRDSAADYSGAAGAYGDDPHGRFIGTRVKFTF